jgi:hypothetical protein
MGLDVQTIDGYLGINAATPAILGPKKIPIESEIAQKMNVGDHSRRTMIVLVCAMIIDHVKIDSLVLMMLVAIMMRHHVVIIENQ